MNMSIPNAPILKDTFFTVTVEDERDMPVEGTPDLLVTLLEDGSYSAYYYDEASDTDRYGTLSIMDDSYVWVGA